MQVVRHVPRRRQMLVVFAGFLAVDVEIDDVEKWRHHLCVRRRVPQRKVKRCGRADLHLELHKMVATRTAIRSIVSRLVAAARRHSDNEVKGVAVFLSANVTEAELLRARVGTYATQVALLCTPIGRARRIKVEYVPGGPRAAASRQLWRRQRWRRR